MGAVLAAVAMLACGGDGDDPPGAHDAAAADDGGAADAGTGAGGGCRDIEHELGTACVPANPQRIVALDSLTVLPTLVELDAPVVGATAVYPGGEPFPTYLDPDATEGVELVGDMQTPNLEAIAALEPDLIIGALPLVEPVAAELEAIAPTVTTRYAFYQPDWLDDVRLVADAVGRADDIEDDITALDERAAEVGDTVAAGGEAPTLTRIDVFQGTPLYYRSGCTWFGSVLADAGIEQPESQGGDDCTPGNFDSTLVYPSLEQLDVLDADAIVAYQQQASSDEVGADPLATLADSPLWADLPAVQDDRVFVLGDAWGLGASITAAHQILDDVETTVFPTAGSGTTG